MPPYVILDYAGSSNIHTHVRLIFFTFFDILAEFPVLYPGIRNSIINISFDLRL